MCVSESESVLKKDSVTVKLGHPSASHLTPIGEGDTEGLSPHLSVSNDRRCVMHTESKLSGSEYTTEISAQKSFCHLLCEIQDQYQAYSV